MVNNTLVSTSKLFRALGDPTRLAVLEKLSIDGEASATELSKPFALTLPAILKHLRVLEAAGLISQKKQGKERRAAFVPETFKAPVEWITTLNGNWKKNSNNRYSDWEEYRKTKSSAIREKLVKKHLYLVKYVAGRISISLPPNVEFNDLVSYGILGLFEAVNKYDVSHSDKFETFAVSHIRNAIISEIKKIDWSQKVLKKASGEIPIKRKGIEEKNRQIIASGEVARSLGLKFEKLNPIYSDPESMNILLRQKVRRDGHNEKNVSKWHAFEDSLIADRYERSQPNEIKNLFAAAIDDLSEKEKLVVYLYYYESLTLKEIGEILDVSESRVCQIHAKVVNEIKKNLSHCEREHSKKEEGLNVAEETHLGVS